MNTELPVWLNEPWNELVETIPVDLEVTARSYKALRRRRDIRSAADLLRLVLIYALTLSLRTTALWAACLGLADVSYQAVAKRVHAASAWLDHLIHALLLSQLSVPEALGQSTRSLVIVDASTLSRPSSPGTEWRLHLRFAPFIQQPANVVLTDAHGGEHIRQVDLQAGDIALADRGYGVWSNMKCVLEAHADAVFRIAWNTFPLVYLEDGQQVDLPAWLKSLSPTTAMTEQAVAARDDPQRRPLRLIAGRLPQEAADRARAKIRQAARRKGRTPDQRTLLAAGFCILVTTLPAERWPTEELLALYRVRWQVEWCIRRWKSLCELKRLPAYPASIAEVVLKAKLVLILLLHQRLARLDLPWQQWWAGEILPPAISTLIVSLYRHLCETVRPAAALERLLENPKRYLRHLCSSRRKRPLQWAEAAGRWFRHLAQEAAPNVA
jgi:hypothetical protein